MSIPAHAAVAHIVETDVLGAIAQRGACQVPDCGWMSRFFDVARPDGPTHPRLLAMVKSHSAQHTDAQNAIDDAKVVSS